jgi:predicted Rossmann fold nucleotide-binding protein DprA/Smf involved in DNA uptake
MFTSGNKDIVKFSKVAFLCSRNIPASVVLKCYDWAIDLRENGVRIISGFQSKIEKDVFHFLLQGTQPIIIAMARGLKKHRDPSLEKGIMQKRLLIVSPFSSEVHQITSKTAEQRNRMMIEMADEIVFDGWQA